MRNFFEFVGELISLMLVIILMLVGMAVIGCDRAHQVVNPVVVEDVLAYAESSVYIIHSGVDVVYVDHKSSGTSITVGGPDSSPVTGVGFIPESFANDYKYEQGSLERDIEGSGFGSSIAIYEGAVRVPMVGSDGVLFAVGAPNADNGAGAVYVFRVGSLGLWFEAKITPHNERTRGFGSEIEFRTSSEGVEYLEILSENRAEAASRHVMLFLSIG